MTHAPQNETGPTFAMLCCAHGAEVCVKDAISQQGWRLAFSRPGFVTAKHDDLAELPTGTFIRTASHSIGHLKSGDGQQQIDGLAELLSGKFPSGVTFDHVHVWPRDRLPIGKFGFEPGIDEVSKLVAEQVHAVLRDQWVRSDVPNRIAESGQRVLDVVLVDPADWFIGWHESSTWSTRWPGAVQPINPQHEPVSRAYYKAAESLAWSGFDLAPKDIAIEVGSAPGGACGRMLELGLRVKGIDPAEMDPRILGHSNFKHLRARAGDLPRSEYKGARWLLADSNVKPEKTLTTIENIVRHRDCTIRGMLITLKLGNYSAATDIPKWIKRIEGWNPIDVRVRQLATNRCEVCVAVTLR